MKANPKLVGHYIQTKRQECQLTQVQLAKILGVSSQSVSNWECGKSFPDAPMLPELSNILHCSIDDILSGGIGCGGYNKHITVDKMLKVVHTLNKTSELLGKDHFINVCLVDALNQRLDAEIRLPCHDESSLEQIRDLLLVACIKNGYYIDPKDVKNKITNDTNLEMILQTLDEHGIH